MYEEKEKTENFWRRKIFFFAEGILQRQEVFTDLKIEEMESFILQILTVLPLFLMVSFVQSIDHTKPLLFLLAPQGALVVVTV